jgi:glycosyltransferase involved in cell wall biosynthesis
MNSRILTALPVYNEQDHVESVLCEVLRHTPDVVVINDGSTDATANRLAAVPGVAVLTHETNLGYGAALKTAFRYAIDNEYDTLVTMDCDGQHQPQFVREVAGMLNSSAEPFDMVSGSRYLQEFGGNSVPPEERRRINARITACLNERLGLAITDAFCGFKAYRVSSLNHLDITDDGYAMPLQLWVQCVDLGWRITEFPVPLLYLDENRSFGGSLDDANVRLAHYRAVLNTELERRGMEQRLTSDCGESAAVQ